jgi:hypothetical protein
MVAGSQGGVNANELLDQAAEFTRNTVSDGGERTMAEIQSQLEKSTPDTESGIQLEGQAAKGEKTNPPGKLSSFFKKKTA